MGAIICSAIAIAVRCGAVLRINGEIIVESLSLITLFVDLAPHQTVTFEWQMRQLQLTANKKWSVDGSVATRCATHQIADCAFNDDGNGGTGPENAFIAKLLRNANERLFGCIAVLTKC